MRVKKIKSRKIINLPAFFISIIALSKIYSIYYPLILFVS
ncbi:putative membrane protein [Escherichia coli 2864350]|nr:putative membrane protein [Escherichia coli 2864350]